MVRDNGNGMLQVEFPVPGMRRHRIKALDAACSALLVAKEAKATAAAAVKRAEAEIQSELHARDLESYVFADGDQKYAAIKKSKDSVALVELKPKARKKRPSDDEQLEG